MDCVRKGFFKILNYENLVTTHSVTWTDATNVKLQHQGDLGLSDLFLTLSSPNSLDSRMCTTGPNPPGSDG